MLRTSLVLLLWGCVGQAFAQFSLDKYLLTADNDKVIEVYTAQLDFLATENLKSPWLHRLEIRARTNDFNANPEDFRFRLNPINPAERKANRRYFETQEKLIETRYLLALNKALKERYQYFLEVMFLLESERDFREMHELLTDKQSLLRSNLGNSSFKLDDYLETDQDLVLTEMDIHKTVNRRRRISEEIRMSYPFEGNLVLDISEIKSIEAIENELLRHEAIDSVSLRLERKNQEIELAEAKLRLDKAKDRRNIGYFQAEYDTERGNDFNEHMGFQIGFRLPFLKPDRPDYQRSRLKLIKQEVEVEAEQNWLNSRQKMVVEEMLDLFEQYHMLTAKLGELERINAYFMEEPLKLIEIRENQFKIRDLHVSLKYKIMELYLRYLDLNGMIVQKPLRNYLSTTNRILE